MYAIGSANPVAKFPKLVPKVGSTVVPAVNKSGAVAAVVSVIAAGLKTDFKFAKGVPVTAVVAVAGAKVEAVFKASPPACVAALCIAS